MLKAMGVLPTDWATEWRQVQHQQVQKMTKIVCPGEVKTHLNKLRENSCQQSFFHKTKTFCIETFSRKSMSIPTRFFAKDYMDTIQRFIMHIVQDSEKIILIS